MALIEKKIVDKMEILENGKIQVREATIIEKDGVEIHRSFHRHIVYPGQDLTGQDPKVVAVANAVWTQEVVDAYLAYVQNNDI
jgi:hypothetical protein